MTNLYIMIIYRLDNYLRKISNTTIEILFKISSRIRPLQKASLIQFQKSTKKLNFVCIMMQ